MVFQIPTEEIVSRRSDLPCPVLLRILLRQDLRIDYWTRQDGGHWQPWQGLFWQKLEVTEHKETGKWESEHKDHRWLLQASLCYKATERWSKSWMGTGGQGDLFCFISATYLCTDGDYSIEKGKLTIQEKEGWTVGVEDLPKQEGWNSARVEGVVFGTGTSHLLEEEEWRGIGAQALGPSRSPPSCFSVLGKIFSSEWGSGRNVGNLRSHKVRRE